MTLLGIDLGATNIAAALVSEDGVIIRKSSIPTRVERKAREIIDDMAALSLDLLKEENLLQRDITAAGMGIPGLADPQHGTVHRCTNLSWQNVPLKAMMQEHLDMQFFLTNDANCAALAELQLGVFRNKKSALLITIGSGVGGGIILDGRLYTGAHGAAGEIGHMAFQQGGELCTCDNKGCFERYASAGTLTRSVSSKSTSAKEVIDAARGGTAEALGIFDGYIKSLSLGIVSLINVFDPEVIALGGGVSEAGDFLLEAVRNEVKQHLLFKDYPSAEIVLAALGNEAGVIGAALYARQCRDELLH